MVVIVSTAPWLIFPTVVPAATIVALVIAGVWLGWTFWRGPATPFDVALLILLLMVVGGAMVSPAPDLAWPKFCGLICGLAAFRAVAVWADTRRRLWIGMGFGLLVGLGFLIPGILSTNWGDKFPPMAAAANYLPRWIGGLPGARSGVNPNALGALVLLVLPGVIVAACLPWRTFGPRLGMSERMVPVCRTAAVILAALLLLLLVLTQSRTAWASLVGTAVVMVSGAAWIRVPRVRVALSIVGVASIVSAVWVVPRLVAAAVLSTDAPGAELTWRGRTDLWASGWNAAMDFPLTGLGLGSFREIAPVLYPIATLPSSFEMSHAHNTFLQVAVDAGLLGLVSYLALLLVAAYVCWRAARDRDLVVAAPAFALAANLLAIHLFGVTDALALGAKIGVLFWLNLGLIAALERVTVETGTDAWTT